MSKSEKVEKVKENFYLAKESVKIRTSHYIIGGVSVAAALAWNSAIKDVIDQVYPMQKESARAAVFYAFVITIFLVILVILLPDTKEMLPSETQAKIIHKTGETQIVRNI